MNIQKYARLTCLASRRMVTTDGWVYYIQLARVYALAEIVSHGSLIPSQNQSTTDGSRVSGIELVFHSKCLSGQNIVMEIVVPFTRSND